MVHVIQIYLLSQKLVGSNYLPKIIDIVTFALIYIGREMRSNENLDY